MNNVKVEPYDTYFTKNKGEIIRLNEFGYAIWQSKKNPFYFAERNYDWVNRVIFTNETDGTRLYLGERKLTDFDSTNWEPMPLNIYKRGIEDKKSLFHEFYGEIQKGQKLITELGV